MFYDALSQISDTLREPMHSRLCGNRRPGGDKETGPCAADQAISRPRNKVVEDFDDDK